MVFFWLLAKNVSLLLGSFRLEREGEKKTKKTRVFKKSNKKIRWRIVGRNIVGVIFFYFLFRNARQAYKMKRSLASKTWNDFLLFNSDIVEFFLLRWRRNLLPTSNKCESRWRRRCATPKTPRHSITASAFFDGQPYQKSEEGTTRASLPVFFFLPLSKSSLISIFKLTVAHFERNENKLNILLRNLFI